ncbi:MAG: RNA polymerase sigma factor [Solirubrobacteraceae bacterium]
MTAAPELVAGAVSVVAAGRAARAPAARVRRVWLRSERSVIAAALAGSEADLEELFRRCWPRAYRTAYLIVGDHAAAEDIAQEAFLAAVHRLERFDRRRRFGPWLSTIVANRAIDWARARAARRETGQEPADSVVALEPQPTGYSPRLMAALHALSVDQRAVVVMRYVLEYTPGEIARTLGLPRGTVNSRLRRGLDALERQLDEEDR